jgi:hypothetical protein
MAMGRTPDGVVLRGNDVAWVYTGFATLNRVLGGRFTDEEAEDRVAEIAECFHQWNAPVSWMTGPSTWPPQLADYLNDNGFVRSEITTGMAADLRSPLPPAPVIEGLRIELLADPEQFKIWTTLNTEPWPREATAAAKAILTPDNAGSDPRCRFYLGYLHNQPVVRGMACVKGDVAGLHWISTATDHRDSEAESALQIALANRALSDARDAEANLAVLVTPHPASLLCRQFHFQTFCLFTSYGWPAALEKDAC